MTNLDRFLDNFFNARIAAQWAPKILDGMGVTVLLAIAVIVAGLAAGLGLAVLRAMGVRVLNWAIIFIVDLFRALPPLVVIVLIFFGLPAIDIQLDGFWAAWLALSLILAAFSEEVFWAGITSVPKGQWEASRSLGLGFLVTFFLVVLPQAIRMVVPPLVNRTIAITKGTALASVVAVPEILGAAQSAVSHSFNATPLTMAAAAYLALFIPVVLAGRWIETRFAWKR